MKVNKKQLKMGIKVEMEHTDDKNVATKIALDHLKEFPDYYTRLINMEKSAKKAFAAELQRENDNNNNIKLSKLL